jgi:hypothetical protein
MVMHLRSMTRLTSRQARAVIVAAEADGFQRLPEQAWYCYDEELFEDASRALEFLRDRDPQTASRALEASDPIPAWAAVERLTNERAGLSHEKSIAVAAVASRHGFTPGTRRLIRPGFEDYDTAREAIAFLWDKDPEVLEELFERRLAPLPETALAPCGRCIDGWATHRFAGPIPADPRHHYSF